MKRPFFSLVVTCFEVERYLGQMLASIRTQDFDDWECVLTCEDSKDGTLALCAAQARADPRFRFCHGPCSGSAAMPRNRGIEQARGEYLVLLDGDDWLADGALARLAAGIRAAGEPPDVVQVAAVEFVENGAKALSSDGRCFNWTKADDGRVLSGSDVLKHNVTRDYVWPMVTLSICRLDFLRENGIAFTDRIKHDDEDWTPRVVTCAKRVLVLDLDLYHYRQRAGSMMARMPKALRLRNYAEVTHAQVLFFAAQDLTPDVAKAVARYYLDLFFVKFFWPNSEESDIPSGELTKALAVILRDGGRAALWKVARHTTVAKCLGAALLMIAGVHPLLDLPARLYFWLYYRLVIFRIHRRGY